MITQEVKLNKKEIYSNEGSQTYFSFLAKKFPESSLLSSAYLHANNILSIFVDSVLFLDNDRFFVKEYETEVGFDKIEPRHFKSWIFNAYISPELNAQFDLLNKFISGFKITADQDNTSLVNNEKNSPFKNLKIDFSKTKDELQIVLSSAGKRLPIDSFGTGIQQILYILTQIFFSKAKIILIEELELNLSPKYQQEILKHINQNIESGKIDQLFFTSHSKYLTYRSDFSVYEITLTDEGNSVCNKVTSPRKIFFEPS